MEKFLITLFIIVSFYNFSAQTYPLLEVEDKRELLDIFEIDTLQEILTQQEKKQSCYMDSGPFCDFLTDKHLGRVSLESKGLQTQRMLKRS